MRLQLLSEIIRFCKTAIEALSSDYSTAFSSTCQESMAQKASIQTIAQKFALHLHCKYNTSQLFLCNYLVLTLYSLIGDFGKS